jgi:integrase
MFSRLTYTAKFRIPAMPLGAFPPRAREVAPRRARDREGGDVFPSLAGKTSSGRNGLSGQFRRVMDRAGIEPEITGRAGEKGRNRSSLSFHSLRHSFNSAMANAGVPQEIRQRLTGHASKAVNDRYTHAELETLKAAVLAVPPTGLSDAT